MGVPGIGQAAYGELGHACRLSEWPGNTLTTNVPRLRKRRMHSFGDEQTRDLSLRPCRDHERTRLRQRLCPRRDVQHVAEYLARRIDNHRP